jgi:hypothetical protein
MFFPRREKAGLSQILTNPSDKGGQMSIQDIDRTVQAEPGKAEETAAVPVVNPGKFEALEYTNSISEEDLKQAANRVFVDFEYAKQGRSEWEKSREEWRKMAKQYRDTKNFPWSGCSNLEVPIIGMMVDQLHARTYEAMFSVPEFVSARPTTATIKRLGLDFFESSMESKLQEIAEQLPQLTAQDLYVIQNDLQREAAARAQKAAKEMAEGIGRFVSSLVSDDMDCFEEGMDDMLKDCALDGSAFKKTFFNYATKQVESVFRSCANVYQPFNADRKTHFPYRIDRMYLTANEIKIGISRGYYRDISARLDHSSEIANKSLIEDQTQKDSPTKQTGLAQGQQGFREIHEWHGYYDFDKDGLEEPVIVILDFESKEILRVDSRIITAVEKTIPSPDGQTLQTHVIEPEKEFDHFTQYTLVPDPGNSYGLGVGSMIMHPEKAISTLLNQTIDNMTLQNNPWYLTKKGSALDDEGDLELYPGKRVSVDTGSEPLDAQVYFPKFQQVNPMVMNLIDFLFELAKWRSSVSDVMTGQSNRVEPATAILAKIEQSTKIFTVIAKRIFMKSGEELQKIYDVYRRYADVDAAIFFLPTTSEDFEVLVSKVLEYSFAFKLNLDPANMNKAEKIAKAEICYTTSKENPLIFNDPVKFWWSTRFYFESLGVNHIWINRLLGDQPPQPQQQLPRSQVEENASVISGQAIQIHDQDDHLAHLREIEAFMGQNNVFYETLNPNQKNIVEAHAREHQAKLYLQEKSKEQVEGPAGQVPGGQA